MATVKVNGVDRSTGYQPDELEAIGLRLEALDGQVGTGPLPIPDDANTEAPYAGQLVEFLVGGDTIYQGFVGPSSRDRGSVAVGTRMLETYTVGDENAAFHGFRAYKWERPYETTRARFLAFLDDFVPWVTDTTWVTTDVVRNLKAKTYTTETLFDELFTEIKDKTGCVAFIEGHRAHLHPPTVGIDSGMTFTDVAADWNGTDVLPLFEPSRSKDPIDLRNDVMVVTPDASFTATDATSITRHDSAGIKHQALIQLDSGDAEDAEDKATAIVNDLKNERKTYEFKTGLLTAEQVLAMPVGSLVTITSAVMRLTDSVQRIGGMTLHYVHPDRFRADLELGYPLRKRRTSSADTVRTAGGIPLPGPETPCGCSGGGCSCSPWFNDGSFDSTFFDFFDNRGPFLPTAGPPATIGTSGTPSSSGHPLDPTVWGSGTGTGGGGFYINSGYLALKDAYPSQTAHVEYDTTFDAPPEITDLRCRIEFDFTFRAYTSDDVAGDPWDSPSAVLTSADSWGARLTNRTGTPHTFSGLVTIADGLIANTTYTFRWTIDRVAGTSRVQVEGIGYDVTTTLGPGADAGIPRSLLIFQGGGGGQITHITRVRSYPLDGAPSTGQQVSPENVGTGDGTTTTFHTMFPWQPGGIVVRINGIDVTDSVTSFDPVTGAITFSTPPAAGSEITVSYVAA